MHFFLRFPFHKWDDDPIHSYFARGGSANNIKQPSVVIGVRTVAPGVKTTIAGKAMAVQLISFELVYLHLQNPRVPRLGPFFAKGIMPLT